MLLEFISILNLLILTFALGCGFYVYFKFIKIKKLKNIIMDIFQARMGNIDTVLSSLETECNERSDIVTHNCTFDKKRHELYVLCNGGNSKKMLGKNLTADQIEQMSANEIEELYNKYESTLGQKITDSLGKTAITLYAEAAARMGLIANENKQELIRDLQKDICLENLLQKCSCVLYHQFGGALAVITTALTTVKHRSSSNTVEVNEVQADD